MHVYRHCNFVGATREGGASEQVSRSGKPGESQEEPTPGSESTDVCAARLLSPLPQGRWRGRSKKRKGVTAPVPARIVRAPGSVPVRRSSCRNRQAASGPKYTRQTRTKKCGQGRANGGLGRGERRRSHVGERVERKDESHLGASRTTTARDREKAQGDVRASSSGRNIAKSGAAVAGPGL